MKPQRTIPSHKILALLLSASQSLGILLPQSLSLRAAPATTTKHSKQNNNQQTTTPSVNSPGNQAIQSRRQLPAPQNQTKPFQWQQANAQQISQITKALLGEAFQPVDIQTNNTQQDDQQIAQTIYNYLQTRDPQQWQKHLQTHPKSRWAIALHLQIAKQHKQQGQLSQEIEQLQQAWDKGQWIQDKRQQHYLNQVWQQLAQLQCSLGQRQQIDQLLKQAQNRWMGGKQQRIYQDIQNILNQMQARPQDSYKCGPYGLTKIRQNSGMSLEQAYHQKIQQEQSTAQGISLERVWQLSQQIGLNYQIAYRQAGAAIITPSLMHWKLGHYSALSQQTNTNREAQQNLYQIQDPTFNTKQWFISSNAIQNESSGYWLVPAGPLPVGWKSLSEQQSRNIYGKGQPALQYDPDAYSSLTDDMIGGCGSVPHGMAWYSFHEMLVSLYIQDRPLDYSPPKGPPVPYRLSYSQQNGQWSSDWQNPGQIQRQVYSIDDGSGPIAIWTTTFQRPEGGQSQSISPYSPDYNSLSDRKLLEQIQYHTDTNQPTQGYLVRRFSDGSSQTYGLRIGAILPDAQGIPLGSEHYLLTQQSDSWGNSLTYHYSTNSYQYSDTFGNTYTINTDARLEAISDAAGQISLFQYQSPALDALVKTISDPFGRSAQINYDNQGRISSITDPIGLTSSFQYQTNSDQIIAMSTPYGTTQFRSGIGPGPDAVTNGHPEVAMLRWIQATDPIGQTERLEYSDNPNGVDYNPDWWAQLFSSSQMPGVAADIQPGISPHYYGKHKTYYWDKKSWAQHPGDYKKAHISHWSVENPLDKKITRYKAGEKEPEQNWLWYSYPGEPNSEYIDSASLTNGQKAVIAQKTSSGQSRYWRWQYNSLGNITQSSDPQGRIIRYIYDSNQNNIIQIQNKNPNVAGGWETLAQNQYNPQNLLTNHTDSAGQNWNYTYNSAGQLTGISDPSGRFTQYNYDSNGYLLNIQMPGNQSLSYTYDTSGRIATITDQDNHTVQYNYDQLDRITQISWPDSSKQRYWYNRLEQIVSQDRQGNQTKTSYNQLGQPITIQDPLGNLSQLQWCSCGGLSQLTDPQGNITRWQRDLQGRIIKKTLPGGRQYHYNYDSADGSLKTITDPLGQQTHYQYNLDGSLQQISRSNSLYPSADLIYTYEPWHARLSQIQDNQGQTWNYTYHPYGQNGAGQLASIDGPKNNDTFNYQYDLLGRIQQSTLAGQTTILQYDNIGRIQQSQNPLGQSQYTYQPNSLRLASIQYPNNIQKTYQYHNNLSDRRLQQSQYQTSQGELLLQNNYQYNSLGQISQWQQIQQQNTNQWQLYYNKIGELIQAEQQQTQANSNQQTILHNNHYDKNHNLIGREQNQHNIGYQVNLANQTIQQNNQGPVQIWAQINKAAQAQINGIQLQTKTNNQIQGKIPAQNLTNNQLHIQLQDNQGQSSQSQWQLSANPNNQPIQNLQYDLNGNLISRSNQLGQSSTYQWDSDNRLIQIQYQDNQQPTNNHTSQFQYNSLGQLSQIQEQNHLGQTISQNQLLWSGARLIRTIQTNLEQNSSLTRHYFAQGYIQQQNNQSEPDKHYYIKDHLGSILAISDTNGQIQASYTYDLWGQHLSQPTNTAFLSDITYAGYYHHPASGLYLTPFRAYDPSLGKWLSADPLGETAGLNLYTYVNNDPINNKDPLGLIAGVDDIIIVGGGIAGWVVPTLGIALGGAFFLGYGIYKGIQAGVPANEGKFDRWADNYYDYNLQMSASDKKVEVIDVAPDSSPGESLPDPEENLEGYCRDLVRRFVLLEKAEDILTDKVVTRTSKEDKLLQQYRDEMKQYKKWWNEHCEAKYGSIFVTDLLPADFLEHNKIRPTDRVKLKIPK